MSTKPHTILDFWFKETSFEKKFKKDISFDGVIREKFLKDYELAAKNEYDDWQDNVKGSLALIILLDQFSRNLFRDNKKAFEQDKTRIVYENDEVGIHHSFVTFDDGNVEAVMAVYKYKDGKIIGLETGATPMPK